MKSSLAFLCSSLVLGLSLAQKNDELPPPVKPQPRQIVPEPRQVVPEPRQVVPEPRQSGCNYVADFTAVGQQAMLKSPNYPYDYPAYANCKYTVSSPAGTIIELQCNEFNVESSSGCSYDVFYFSPTGDSQFRDAARTCGRGQFSRNSTTNAMTIGFNSDAGNPYSPYPYGFQCILTVISSKVAPTAAPATTTTAKPVTSTLSSISKPANTSCSCGVRNEGRRIVGGTEAGINEFPWRCALYHPEMGIFCGATIINEQYVLTAAHCTNAIPTASRDKLQVDCSEHDISSGTETANVLVPVSKIIQHASYNTETQDNDVALCKLATPLTYSRTIQPVCLPWKMVGQTFNGLTVTASGWGTTSSGGSQSKVLKKVDLPTLGTQECQKYYGSAVTDNMMCTYAPGTDTCQGDSGGSIDYKDPATGRYMNIGAVSWGVGCAGKDQPGVYAKVTNYLSWIEAQTAGTSYCKI